MNPGNKGLGLIVAVVIAGTLTVCAVLVYTSVFRYKQQPVTHIQNVSPAQQSELTASDSANNPNLQDKLVITSSGGISTPVTYEPPKVIHEEDKTRINERVVLPFLEHYMGEASGSSISAIVVTKNQNATRQSFPYLIRAILSDGTYLSFSVESGIPWWQPE